MELVWLRLRVYQISVTNAEKGGPKGEEGGETTIMPFLMAEQDAMNKVETEKKLAYEKEVMKNVKGGEAGRAYTASVGLTYKWIVISLSRIYMFVFVCCEH